MTVADRRPSHQAVPICQPSRFPLASSSFAFTTSIPGCKMPGTIRSSAALVAVALGLAARVTNAYTQVNIASPYMHKNIDPIVSSFWIRSLPPTPLKNKHPPYLACHEDFIGLQVLKQTMATSRFTPDHICKELLL